MAIYVLAFKGGGVPESEEEQQAVMAAWGGWFGAMGDAVLDGGNPFGASATVAGDGTVSDGAASALTGYAILRADDLGAATEMAKTCPILADGSGSIEVYETFDLM
jgi:hypothetical protein